MGVCALRCWLVIHPEFPCCAQVVRSLFASACFVMFGGWYLVWLWMVVILIVQLFFPFEAV